jgi:energy-coupling factor transporter ATP-binding protein EcfA2
VNDALVRMKLDAFRKTKLEKASAMIRRGTHLAAALATGAGILVLSDPEEDLDAEAARGFVATVTKAIADKEHLVFRGKTAPVGSYDLALVFSGGTLIAEGTPEELAAATRTFFVRLSGAPAMFVEQATAREWKPEQLGPAYLRITLPEGTGTHAAFALASETEVTITELSPVAVGHAASPPK